MLEILSYRIGLWKSQRKKREVFRRYKKQRIKAQKENKSNEEIGVIDNDFISELHYIEDDIAEMQQGLLVTKAEKYLIVTPAFDLNDGNNLEEARTGNRYLFNRETVSSLNDAIRREEKERRERLQSWLVALAGVIAALTGIVGALIGLFSVLQ